MDKLKLSRVFIVGHSIAGAELSSLGAMHPERIAGLVYLEAGYPYAFRSRGGPTMQEFLDANGGTPQSPSASEKDLASFTALRNWESETFGFRMPASEFRQTWDSTPDGRPVKPREPLGIASMMTLLSDTATSTTIRVPALVIFAIPHVHEPWINARDPEARTKYYDRIDKLAKRQASAVERTVPNARVTRLHRMHYLFLSNTADVLREIRGFTEGRS